MNDDHESLLKLTAAALGGIEANPELLHMDPKAAAKKAVGVACEAQERLETVESLQVTASHALGRGRA
jgi:hypothetical protein